MNGPSVRVGYLPVRGEEGKSIRIGAAMSIQPLLAILIPSPSDHFPVDAAGIRARHLSVEIRSAATVTGAIC